MIGEEKQIDNGYINTQQEDFEAKIKMLMNSVSEKEEILRKAELEIKLLSRSKEEILKIINEKNQNLAAEVMEMIPEREKLLQNEITVTDKEEKILTKCWVPNKKSEKLQFLDKNKILAKINQQNNTAISYNSYEKEILTFFSGDEEGISSYNHEAEDVVKIDELKDIDWQYVLVFPNPDFAKDKIIMDETKAFSLFDKFFVPDKRKSEQKASLQENMVFMNTISKTVEKEVLGNSNFLYKVNKGGTMENDKTTEKWKCVTAQSKDLQTLIRNISLYKLTKVLHFQTFSLLSERGDYIYVLIHANDDILKNEADWQEYPLQFEIGSTDLISLEPCESKLIPYRSIMENKPNDIIKLEEETENFFKFIYEDDWENFVNMKSTIPSTISQLEWDAYKTFLEILIIHKNQVITLATLDPIYKGVLARELYTYAYSEVFKEKNFKLKNLWDYYEIQPTAPFKNYFREYDKFTGVDKANQFWKRYITGKKKGISLFTSVDKIKLILICLYSQLKLDKMVSDGFLVNYFPLHSWDFTDTSENKNIVKGDLENQNILKNDHIKISIEKNGNPNSNEKPNQENVPIHQNEKSNNIEMSSAEIKEFLTKKFADDEETYSSLKTSWKFSWVGRIPSTKIKKYFGEKVGFYFEFLSYYTFSLLFLGIFGLVTYIVQNQDSLTSKSIEFFSELGFKKTRLTIAFNTLYSFVVILWSTIFLELWKRKEAEIATKWGENPEDEAEDILPSYRGNPRRSPINDSLKEIYYPWVYHLLKKILSYIISLIMVALVIFIVVILLYFRNWLVENQIGGKHNRFIINVPTILNTIQIFLFDWIHRQVALFFTNFENHKTFDSYEFSFSTKIFIFQAVNSFNSLFIIAFIKKSIDFMGGCVKTMQFSKEVSILNYCEEELENQMVTIVIINFLKNITEIAIPWLSYKFKTKKVITNKIEESVQDYNPIKDVTKVIDIQNTLSDYNKGYIDETLSDYMELAIQFGFITLFPISFPLAPIIAWVTNMCEIQVDKIKLMYLSKRPNPLSATGIENWYYIFEFITFVSIFTNVALLIFTSNNYFELTTYEKTVLYMSLVFFYIVIKLFITRVIPDSSIKVSQMKRRMAYVVEKNCNGFATQEKPNKYVRLNLKIHTT